MCRALCFAILTATASPLLAGTQTISMFSPSNGRNLDVVVYTPPNYSATTGHYPVVLDLHGMGGSPTNRSNLQIVPYLDAAITSGQAMPAIWVFANGQTDSFYGDAFDGHRRVYTHTIEEVLPYVEANFRTIEHRRLRAIQGFSMGGFGAMMYAAKRTDLFSAVVGYGGAYQNWQGLLPNVKSEMYNNVQANFTPYSVYDQIQLNAETIAEQLKIRMLVGGNDPIQASNQNLNTFLNNQLAPHGIPNITLTIVPGIGHDGKRMFETGLGLEFINDHFASILPGDANLDESVSFDDLLLLAQHYGRSADASWLEGDFDGNGAVDFEDLLALAQNYSGSSVTASASFDTDWRLARSLVPEPALAAAALAGAAPRRRRV